MTSKPSAKKLAADAYKTLIDQAVEQARGHGRSERISKDCIFSKAPAHRRFNEFIGSLTAEQRVLLADMLQEERRGTIHDLFARLTEWIDLDGLGFTLHEQPMPVDFSGMGLHGDFVGRLDDWEWPEEPDEG